MSGQRSSSASAGDPPDGGACSAEGRGPSPVGDEGYRLLFEQMDSMVCTLDLEGRFTSVNRAGERLTGYRADELVGMLAVELIAPEHRDEAVRQFSERLSGGADHPPQESELVTRDGRRVPIEVTSTIVDFPERPAGVVGLVRDLSSVKSTENALLESEHRFRSAFDFAAIGMALLSRDARFIEVNGALCSIVGYGAEELVGRSYRDVTHDDDVEAQDRYFAQLLAGEIRAFQMEKRYVHRDGHEIWAILSVSLVRAGDGTPLHFISQVQDIDARKCVEQEIARSEARLAEAQQTAGIGSWEWDVESNVVTWSDELYRIFGLDLDAGDLCYETYLEKLHPWDVDRVDAIVRGAFETGESFEMEHRVLLAGGSVTWVHGRGQVEQRDGRTVRMRGTAQDITERKAAEEALREAEKRYRTLVEQLPLVTYIRPLDMAEANVYVSPQVQSLLGYSAEEWSTNPKLLASIVHPDDWKLVRTTGERVRRTGEPSRLEYRYLARDGRIVWVQDETYVVQDERGEPRSVQGYLLDITERKLAEEQRDRLRDELHQAQRLEALGLLAGGVAHDFNNMLTAIEGYSVLLLDSLDPGSPARKEAEQIRRAAEQAAALPRKLLAFSRKQVLKPQLVDLADIVLEAGDLLGRLVGETIEVAIAAGARPAQILADPGQIEQALVNLTVNARAAMPDGGTIEIATDVRDVGPEVAAEHEVEPRTYAVLSVRDAGQGMDAETATRVFEPFFTTKAPGEGSGLGLSTVYGVVRQSGGFVLVESSLGSGSCFELYFPTADDVGPQEAASAVEAHAATVLLVEDEELVRDLATTALERSGYVVLATSNAAEALELLDRRGARIDVLVTDLVMPGMGGRELVERVLERLPEISIVLMSGYTNESTALDGVVGPSGTFLEKPFSPHDLVAAVASGLRERVADSVGMRLHAAREGGAAPVAVTCVVADDHPAVLDSVSRYLGSHGVEVVARVARGDEALSEIERLRPAVALLDVSMKPLSGIEVVREAAARAPESRIVLYTGHRDARLLEQALDAGACGFVLKETPLPELVRAVAIVGGGGTYVDPELSSALASAKASTAASPLTPRECQILSLVSEGLTNEKVADTLGISAETVQSHVRNTMAKLEADTRTAAVATAIRLSLIG